MGSSSDDGGRTVAAALEGRTVWFYGMFGPSTGRTLRGGQRVVLQHARILRSRDVECSIVGLQGPIRRRLPIIGDRPPADLAEEAHGFVLSERRFRGSFRPDRDVLVVPGRFLSRLPTLPGRNKVVFSQGVFVTMKSLGLEDRAAGPWRAPDLRAILCVSEGNADILRLARPGCPVLVVANAVNPREFRAGEKERLVLTNGLHSGCEKNPEDTATVAQLLFARATRRGDDGLRLCALEGMSHQEVRALMSRARVLLFLSTHEGQPLLPLEAALSGVLPLAIDRRPMSDTLPERCLFGFGDLEGLVRAVEDALDHPENWRTEIERVRERVQTRFSPEVQEESVLAAWREIAPLLE